MGKNGVGFCARLREFDSFSSTLTADGLNMVDKREVGYLCYGVRLSLSVDKKKIHTDSDFLILINQFYPEASFFCKILFYVLARNCYA